MNLGNARVSRVSGGVRHHELSKDILSQRPSFVSFVPLRKAWRVRWAIITPASRRS